ncbi:DUF6994 family protein [Leifsonia sp. Root112D2]|uniref:DUF6994 family protein n=1 Tax=Leifsonia sp. Root112D2 TaxID=1736426 RepID=UPI0006F98583|nr:hypothetical protein [Leifsonia sp. Root112D2]KQV08576.1 hypothetical protein ASC63_13505 [Leifsonia sp. Root112D2]
MTKRIDISLDVRSDSGGKDPDRHSATLRRYHQLLWSKPLPNGAEFTLDTTTPGVYLHHESALGEFELSSDSIVHPFDYWFRTEELIKQIPQADLDDFNDIGSTIGGYLVFPSNPVDGGQTINMARGRSRKIDDRIDLTLECIRRHYVGESSPLAATLALYQGFFSLFGDFEGYVNFFLLEDLIRSDGVVNFFLPFEDFSTPTLPATVEEYQSYRKEVTSFVVARNHRIAASFS